MLLVQLHTSCLKIPVPLETDVFYWIRKIFRGLQSFGGLSPTGEIDDQTLEVSIFIHIMYTCIWLSILKFESDEQLNFTMKVKNESLH